MIYAYQILKKIIDRKDSNEIIRLSKNIDEPIRLRDLVLSKIEESVLDEFPIVELDIKYLDDLLSLNKSSTRYNYRLEILQVQYIQLKSNYGSRLSELNVDNLKGLKKLHLINLKEDVNVQDSNLREDMFSYLDNLEDLKISDSLIDNSSICRLRNLNKLKKFVSIVRSRLKNVILLTEINAKS